MISTLVGVAALMSTVAAPATTLTFAPTKNQVLKYQSKSTVTMSIPGFIDGAEITNESLVENKVVAVSAKEIKIVETLKEEKTVMPEELKMLSGGQEAPSMVGRETTTSYDTTGKMLKTEVTNQPEVDGMFAAMMEVQTITPVGFQDLVFPDKAVSNGDKWSVASKSSGGGRRAGGKGNSHEFELTKVEMKDGMELAVIKSKSSAVKSSSLDGPQGAFDLDLAIKTESLYWVDTKSGVIQRIETTRHTEVVSDVFEQKQVEKTVTELVK